MIRLPLLVSVPHAGLQVPPEAADLSALAPEQIARDGDEQAAEIYLPLRDHVSALVTTAVARAFVDVNRPPQDRGPDGAVKTRTIWNEPVWREPLPPETAEELLRRYHRPYHERLSSLAQTGLLLGIDCHTMAAQAPPISPDHGRERPPLCLSDADGTCPRHWMALLARALEESFGRPVAINDPFRGGHIIRAHAAAMPWVQLEISRADFMAPGHKRQAVLAALIRFGGEAPSI